MSDTIITHPTRRRRMLAPLRRHTTSLFVALAALIFTGVSQMTLAAHPEMTPRFRLSMEPILSAPAMVQVHVAGALGAFAIGLVLLARPKGVGLHKTLGWAWVTCMAITAVSSFFLTGLMGRSYSPIHALSAWVMIVLPFGITAIRRRNVKRHASAMTNIFLGGMVIAGLFSFLPGRIMWQMFFAS